MAQGMELLDNGTKVFTGPGAAFGTDALLLARFAMPRRKETALDLCSGCGIVALAWHDAGHRGLCTAVELDADASALCRRAVQETPGAEHITTLCTDLRTFCKSGPEQGMTSPPATRPILPADMSARMPAAPRPGMTAAARCRMLPPVRPAPCTMAANWPYATARNRWRRCLPRSVPLGWSPSGWLWCARMNTANPGCFWWKPRKEESRGSGGRRTF